MADFRLGNASGDPYTSVSPNQTPSTMADWETSFNASVISNIDETDFATAVNPIVTSATAPSTPATGLGWFDTDTDVFSIWNGSAWVMNTSVSVSGTAPTDTTQLWYDTTLNLLRVYDTKGDLTGWHPVDSGYTLMVNKSGTDPLAAGMVVVRDNTGDSDMEFTTTTNVKDQGVLGVLMESTADDGQGVVARVGSGAIVDVLADDGEADGAIAKGDVLVTYSVAGECRTGGTYYSNPRQAEGTRVSGVQVGAFAEALGTKDAGTHLVSCRLLPAVGSGLRVQMKPTSIGNASNNSASTTSSWATMTATSTLLETTKHSPVVNMLINFNAQTFHNPGSAAFETCTVEVILNTGGTTWYSYPLERYWENTASGQHSNWTATLAGVGNIASGADLGDKFAIRMVNGANINTTTYCYLQEYVC